MTNLGKGSRKGLTDGLRDFIRADHNRALDVGELHRGTGTLKVRKPKVPEGGSDVTIRKSPDELTFMAEEVNTSKARIDVNHIKPERWSPFLVDADWYALCQASYKGIEGEDWEEIYDSYKAMSKALGVKEQQEAQKARALWAMNAAKDRREEFDDPARKDDILGRKKRDWSCGKSTSKTQLWPWTKAQVRGISVLKWLKALWKQGSNGMRSGGVGSDAAVVGRGPVTFSGCLGQCASTHNPTQWNVPGRYGPCGELFFFLLEKEPMVLRELSRLVPSIRSHGELLLQLVQKKPNFVPDSEAFNSYIGDGFLVPELKDESEASKDEQTDSSSENNVGSGALFVIGLEKNWRRNCPLPTRLGGGKGSLELPKSPGHAVPGVA